MKRLKILFALLILCGIFAFLTSELIAQNSRSAINMAQKTLFYIEKKDYKKAVSCADELGNLLRGKKLIRNLWLNKTNTENAFSFYTMAQSYCQTSQWEDAAANLELLIFYLENTLENIH